MIDPSQLLALPNKSIVLAASAVAIVCPADVTEDILASIPISANAMGPNGRLRITSHWSFTNNANNKTLRVRYSGGAGTQFWALVQSADSRVVSVVTIANRNATNVQFGDALGFNSTSGGVNSQTPGAIDTTLPTSLVLTGQKAVGGDVLTLESYLVELFPS